MFTNIFTGFYKNKQTNKKKPKSLHRLV